MATESNTAKFQNSNVREPESNPKISLREQYLQEKQRIQHEIGDLEQIRLSLGYSQRRMCQLLLVDPSAWTRWCKTPDGAPPHIYQALRWLVELRKVNPDAAAPSNIARRIDFIQSTTQSKIKELESSLAMMERALSLTATVQPSPINYSLPTEHLEKEIFTLKSQLALLIAKKSSPQSKPKKKQPRPKPKAQKKKRTKSQPAPKNRSKTRRKVAAKKLARKKK